MSNANRYLALFHGVVVMLFLFAASVAGVVFLGFASVNDAKHHLQSKLMEVANYSASIVDVEKHQRLNAKEQTRGDLYQEVIRDLVKVHNSFAEVKYLYTLIYRDGQLYFILDTATSALLEKDHLKASLVMEEYDNSGQDDAWIKQVIAGDPYVDEEVFSDQFGSFVSATVPLFDRNGVVVAMLGVDMDASDYEQRFSKIYRDAVVAIVISMLVSIMAGVYVFLSQRKLALLQQETYLLMETDALTGAYNRHFFKRLALNEWELYRRYGVSFSIIVFDIDHFKMINDQFGHEAGDQVLIEIVRQVQTEIRSCESLIRMGGEEFVVFLPQTDLQKAVVVANRIHKVVSNIAVNTADNQLIKPRVSVGLACVLPQESTFQDVLRRADKALYVAKQSGRDRVVVGDSNLSDAKSNPSDPAVV